ncbi:MBL fold metallo-hydrolase [Candidatus Uhrbacteria bacterium]|nr:MBL fold metallo-hydrolase [Candidatus Uhrbacteria bacterium]
MVITWLGQSCFKIQVKGDGDKEVTIVIDPYAPSLGLKLPRNLSADLLLMTHAHTDHHYREGVAGEPFVIEGPGEYETKGVFVYGIATAHDGKDGAERGGNTMYHISAEGLTLLHCGDLGHPLTEAQLAIVEDAHILCVPVGGNGTLDAQGAGALVAQIEPRIIIPMHYMIPGVTMKLDSVDRFCREMGVSAKERLDKLRMTVKDLPQEEVRTVLLESQ